MFYIALDLETGGIEPNVSILTAYFAIYDAEFNCLSELDLKLKPDDGIYRVTGGGLAVNKIDLVEHDKVAITYKQGGQLIYRFLSEAFVKANQKLVPLGHGVAFDVKFLFAQGVISQGSWENFVSYRPLDTSPVAQFLRSVGVIPDSVPGSLKSLVEHFKLPDRKFHGAKEDTLASVDVLKAMQESLKRAIGGHETIANFNAKTDKERFIDLFNTVGFREHQPGGGSMLSCVFDMTDDAYMVDPFFPALYGKPEVRNSIVMKTASAAILFLFNHDGSYAGKDSVYRHL